MKPPVRIGIKIALTVAMILIALAIGVVIPARHVLGLREDLRDKGDEVLQAASLLAQFRDPEAQWIQAQQQMKHLDVRFPSAQDIPFVLKQLGEKSQELGIQIVSENPLPQEVPQGSGVLGARPAAFEKRQIYMELQCSYEALGEFLLALSHLPTFFVVDEMDMVGKTQQSALEIRLVLGFYVRLAAL